MGKLRQGIDDISGSVIVLIIAAFVAGVLGTSAGSGSLTENLSNSIITTFIDNAALWGLALVLAIIAGIIGVKFFRSD